MNGITRLIDGITRSLNGITRLINVWSHGQGPQIYKQSYIGPTIRYFSCRVLVRPCAPFGYAVSHDLVIAGSCSFLAADQLGQGNPN